MDEWKVLQVENQTQYAIISPDGETAYLVGEIPEVAELFHALDCFLDSEELPETISPNDPRLGGKWVSVLEVHEEFGVPLSTVRTWTKKIETMKRGGRTVMPLRKVRHQVALWREWKAGSRPHLEKKGEEVEP